MKELYANIIVDISHEKLDRSFQYKVPVWLQEIVEIGMLVEIPFGKGNRVIKGYVVGLTHKAEFEISRIKEVIKIISEGMPVESRMIQLAWWIKNNYGSTMNQALKTVMPVKDKIKTKEKKTFRLLLDKEEAKALLEVFEKKHQTARERLLRQLMTEEVVEYEILTKELKISSQVIRLFISEHIMESFTENKYRNPVKENIREPYRLVLNEEQQGIVSSVMKDYNKKEYKTYLLHGVTGSGKTEVYMELIAQVISKGRQAIVLIPEIALTRQTVERFYRRFGNRITTIHSRLSKGERYDQMLRARNGEIDVIIGPRSALFTPFPDLGLIVIDEEHEKTYKSDGVPKYHARETAIERARMAGASVVLGSATPSVESYYKALNGEYKLFALDNRVNTGKMAKVYTADLREELRKGNRSIVSEKLRELIEERLRKREQIILFINRRGYAGFVSCRSCGHVIKCPHCDVSLSLHNNQRMVCHYCGYEEPKAVKCPSCGSKYIGGFRAGTQQIEEVIQKEFPMARTLRMDRDTTKGKYGHERILASFSMGKADILIGTQMIVKGHDFPNVTLVGILAADLSLYANDYRAGERTFQLLTQAAGRAGRGEKEGEVVIQTYNPDHYSIVAAKDQDYKTFYDQEIAYRELLDYPPAAHILAVLISSEEEEKAWEVGGILRKYLEPREEYGLRVIGPADESISKIKDIYKKIIYIKSQDYEILTKVKDQMEEFMEESLLLKNVSVQFDFDPMNSY